MTSMVDRVYAFFASKQRLMRDIRQVREDAEEANIKYHGDMFDASCTLERIGKERDAYYAAAVEEGLRTAEYAKWIRRNKQKVIQ